MSEDFPNRQTIRLRGFDYSTQELYFVTVCTHNRENLLGKIKNGKMVLNDVGKLTNVCWQEIPIKFTPVKLDKYQIMPNHMHMIINIVGARSSRPNDKKIPTLGQIIAFFKYSSTKLINNLPGGKTPPLQNQFRNLKFWQRNYYDHIIRNETEYSKICYYIINNPKTWDQDKNNLTNNAY